MNLDEKIKKYFELKQEIERLDAEKEELSESIKAMVGIFPDQAYTTPDGYSAKVVSKTNYKYADETAIINYFNNKKLGDIYLIRKIDTSKLNKELKTHGVLYNDLSNYIVESISDSLTVKEN